MPIAKHCFVAGRVQGVFYRASAQQQARNLSITGYAKNLADGRVEVLAVGEPTEVDVLVQWLWTGSSTSRVTGVDIRELKLHEVGDIPKEFVIA